MSACKSRFTRRFQFLLTAIVVLGMCVVPASQAKELNWIWTPMQTVAESQASEGECYFRRKFTLVRPEQAELEFAAGDEFEIHINGRLASRGQSFGQPTKIDVIDYVVPGVNLIAVRVRHHDGNQVGLAMRFRCKEVGETRWRGLTTDGTWKTKTDFIESWNSTNYNDMGWLTAQVIGSPASSADEPTSQADATPSGTKATTVSTKLPTENPAMASQSITAPAAASAKKTKASKFEIDDEFSVQQVLAPAETGSLIALEFNEFGKLLLSREGGPLLIADPTKPESHPERVRVYCNQVTTCQGILPLNGEVFVTGTGPTGLGLYRLADSDRDGMLEIKSKLLSFSGKPGEHGPHGIRLGPDGMLYVVVGNGSQVMEEVSDSSPYKHFYEGDLIPRYEDPGGHAQGVKAPGGTVIRCSLSGQKIERVCGGIRNAYDVVFDHRGELYIHDSDMEADAGTTWYRPTYVFHAPAGAEFGWRSGWAKFPQYFIDQTPAVTETGRGSPTGAELYQHLQFPVRYQNTMFLADWSEGRILAMRTQPSGAGYTATVETFMKGRPLNVVDLSVGEDGALYFCTGGRGTEGGVYRIVWNGQVPEKMLKFDSDLEKVVRHPQPGSPWARQNIAQLKIAMGEKKWTTSLEGVAREKRNSKKIRMRALQLMVFYGPTPSGELLESISQADDVDLRAQAARLCGLKREPKCEEILGRLVKDSNPLVRRIACESFMRIDVQPELESLLPMLSSTDRVEALSARRLIERMPVASWEEEVFNTEDKRLFVQGATALMTAYPNLDRAYKVLAKASTFMEGFVNDYDFVDMLRTMELALVRGKIDPSKVPGLAIRIGNEFPSGNSQINRELARLMAYLKVGDLHGRIEDYLQSSEATIEDKVHVGMYLQSVGARLTPDARIAIIDALETARNAENTGGSYRFYLERAVEDISRSITLAEVPTILENGHRWPNAVVAAFYKLPAKIDAQTVQSVIAMDEMLRQNEAKDAATNQCRLGVIAILARNGDETSMNYLRTIWQQEEDRRSDITIGLAQQPEGENWAYLVSSLPILDDLTAKEVIQKLVQVKRRPRDPVHYHDAIEMGYRLRSDGAQDTVRLLKHWAGEEVEGAKGDWRAQLIAWQNWYQTKWPEGPSVDVAKSSEQNGGYSTEVLLASFEKSGLGDPQKGHAVFAKAQCASCHQFSGNGMGVGPDLTSMAHRFSIREALEATLEPSKVIPERYSSKTVLTVDGTQFTGMVVEQADGSYFVLQQDGKRVRVSADDVEELKPSKVSAMPDGLLNGLTQTEIRDLFGYLMQNRHQVADNPSDDQSPPNPSVSAIAVDNIR